MSSDAKDEVYAAFDPLIERPVAIKAFRLPLDNAPDSTRIKQIFYAEMQRVGALIHPNIVTLYDAGEYPGALFIASEFVDGASLAERLDASAMLELPMRVSMLMQLIDALEYAHDAATPHLSLKPRNVYIGSDYTLKLGGFGVATVLDALAPINPQSASPITRYTAPERLRGERGDARADVYSLAQLALDLLVGPQFAPADPGWTAESVPPPPAALADAGVDGDRWTSVFRRALADDPDRRYTRALTFKFELVLLLGISENDAVISWETARARGELAALIGRNPDAPREDLMATMLAQARTRLSALDVSVADDPDTGAHNRTMLSPSGEHVLGPLGTLASPSDTTETMRTPEPFRKDVAASEEETRPPKGKNT